MSYFEVFVDGLWLTPVKVNDQRRQVWMGYVVLTPARKKITGVALAGEYRLINSCLPIAPTQEGVAR